MIEVRESVGPEGVAAVEGLAEAAADVDGWRPFGEDTLLRLRRGEPGATHLVAGETEGYAYVAPGAPAAAELAVHPDARNRGLGRALVEAALQQARGRGELRIWAHGDLPAAQALAARTGFREVRRLLQLRRPLTGQLPDLHVPEGITLRAFRPGEDDKAWLEVNAQAFASHPEQGRMTQADLDARMAEDWFDPEGFFVAEDEQGAMAGFHWTKTHADEAWDSTGTVRGPVGEVYALGIAPGRQGGGLGRALTAAGLHRMQGQGLDRVLLYVEADNAPALALYERSGFTLWSADVMFGRAVDGE